jgi:predicted anti-sigma-YlaC factor YlaD
MAFDGKEESMNHDHLREELDLDLEEMLAPAEKARLESHLASCADCRRERESLQAVHLRLSASVVEPREGFTGEVMRALVPAPWEARAVVVWRWPFALLVALAGVAAVLLGGAAAELEPSAGSFDAFFALARLMESAALAGAGLLGASWRGLGSGLAEWLALSKANLAIAGGLLLALNLLLLRLLRPTPGNATARKSR